MIIYSKLHPELDFAYLHIARALMITNIISGTHRIVYHILLWCPANILTRAQTVILPGGGLY